MPSREVHAVATLALAGGIAIFAPVWPEAALAATGALAGLLVHPDLDVSGQPYWLLYAKTHKHRGFSHVPILGTAERIAWLLGPPVAAMLIAGMEMPWAALVWWAGGLVLADALHTLLDIIF